MFLGSKLQYSSDLLNAITYYWSYSSSSNGTVVDFSNGYDPTLAS